jgi:archaellin
MGSLRSAALISMILLITFILLGVVVASVITGVTSETTNATEEQNYEQMIEETIDEIATYIQIRDQRGKYYEVDAQMKIQKIALLISPLVSQDIDVTGLTIMLDNGENVRVLYYSGSSSSLGSNTLFEHTIWDSLDSNDFSFITIIDDDNSLVDYNIINDYRDNAYLIFKLPPDMQLVKRDKMVITLFPSTGIDRTIFLEAPPALTSVVDFGYL